MLWRNNLKVNISQTRFVHAGLPSGETFKTEGRHDFMFTLKIVALSQLIAYRCYYLLTCGQNPYINVPIHLISNVLLVYAEIG